MLKIIENGNIFDSKCEALVNPVNCVGVMGKGLALEFKKRYPDSYKQYRRICEIGVMKPGTVFASWDKDELGNRCIFLFPTKKHWRDPSSIEFIESGLDHFKSNTRFFEVIGVNSVAFPMLGCGCGGLKKEDVLPLMIDKLKDLDIDVEIYT